MSLKGRKIEIKPLGDADAAALFAAIDASRAALKRRMRWVGGIASAGDCESFIKKAAGAAWGVFEIKTGELVGLAGVARRGEGGLAELSGWVRSDRWDRGYGSEAGKLCVAEAFKGKDLHRLYARIDPANRAARRVLRRLGFRYEGCLRDDKKLNGRWIDQECWGLLKREWKG